MGLNSTDLSHKSSPDYMSKTAQPAMAMTPMLGVNEAAVINGNANVILEMWSLSTRVALSTSMLFIMTVAIVGNLLVITVILQNRGMRTRTNMFLCSLAISDFLCAVCDMPFSLVTVLTGRWLFTDYGVLCQLNGFLMPLFFVNSTHTLMYIAVHKYVSIRYPFTVVLTERRILLMIAAAWTWAAVISTLTITGLSTVHHKLYTTQCGATIPTEAKAFSHLALVLVTCYLVPLGVIVFCYSSLFHHIREHGDRLEMTSTTDRSTIDAQQRRILFTLFLVVVAFVVSWTPWGIYSIYLTIIQEETSAVPLANPLTYLFGYLNSACSPIIYAFRSEAFRNGYRDALCRRKWKRFSVGSRISYNISDHFRFSVKNGNPWQLDASPSNRGKSLVTVTKYCSIDEKRFSTCSLPANAITSLKPMLHITLEHPDEELSPCDRQSMTPEPKKLESGDSSQSAGDSEDSSKTRVHISRSFGDFPSKCATQNSSGVGLPANAVSAIEAGEEDLISEICFRPRFRTMDWTLTEQSGSGCVDSRWKMRRDKERKITAGCMIPGQVALNPFTANCGSTKIHTVPCFQEHRSTSVEPQENLSFSTGIEQTVDNEALTTPKNWRKRLSSKWKRHSQKTSSHKSPNSRRGSSSSKEVRRSVTIKPIPCRRPSVERLDHSSEPRQRTMTEVPAAYRRRRTGADCLGISLVNPQQEQLTRRCTTGVRKQSEKLQERKGPEENGGGETEFQLERERKDKERDEKREEETEWIGCGRKEMMWGGKEGEEIERPKETSNALEVAEAVPADGKSMSPSRTNRLLSHPFRFLSRPCDPSESRDPCEPRDPALSHSDSTQRGGTLKQTRSPVQSKRGQRGGSM